MTANMKVLSLSGSLFIAASVLFTTPTVAHESRMIGDGAIQARVGWGEEPTFEKNINAFELIIEDDMVIEDPDLTVHVLYLKDDAPDAEIVASQMLKGDLLRSSSDPNRFNIWFLPTKAGVYGFIVKGMINGTMIDEKFICEGGSLDPNGSSFACVDRLQGFPGGPKNSPAP